ncbi:MAG: response regulator [Chloroflexi bacterium]|nr:response regulator [Chloroflexota bacterium]
MSELNSLVNEAISLSEPRWRTQAQASGTTIAVETSLQDIPPVQGDQIELREVLTNLIFNAVDAMPAGGRLTILTRSEEGHVFLCVKDTGVGMTAEVLRRCTEPFFTTKGPRGTGLGLKVVHDVVQRHQSNMNIGSEVGKGTTVTIRIPVPTRQEVSGGRTLVPAPTRPLRVLLVDDEPVPLQTIVAYLTSKLHAAETAPDGRQAVEKLRTGRFDALVTDLAMPEMDGIGLASVAKQIAPAMPVILVSGFAGQLTASGGKPQGIDAILSKPINVDQLLQTLGRLTT